MSDLTIRRADDADLPAILDLLRASMGRADDDRFETLFRWKHLENAYGPSPMWVACEGERLAGLRVFMRWEFESDDGVLRAVRAVDTATHPDFQGRGIFTQLTMLALEEVSAEGVDFVFNTPNDNSRPGYLKMGWHELGRPIAAVRPTRLGTIHRLRSARTAAAHWSEPCAAGVGAIEFLRDQPAVDRLLARHVRSEGALRTRLTPAVLAWRFGLPELAYRVIADDSADGVAFVRIRRRGGAREAAVALDLASPDNAARRRLFGRVRRALRRDADYLLALGSVPGFVPVRRLGPLVTARAAAGEPPHTISDLDLKLGDVELF
jgi:hypothetical protein